MEPHALHSPEAQKATSALLADQSADFNLDQEAEDLVRSPQWQTGIARKVLVQYPDFQITLRQMKAGAHIPNHHNPGRICVQTVMGRIRMRADGKIFDLPKGSILVLDRAVMHDVEAVEESAFLLTVALPEDSVH
jgi:quercetin dioxygenase-like cupin family protein